MTCSIVQAFKDRWAEAASSYGIFGAPSTDGQDNRFYQDGTAMILPEPPYVVLEDLGGGTTDQTHDLILDSRPLQLRIYAPTRAGLDGMMIAARKMYDADKANWHPETDEGVLVGTRISRGSWSRLSTNLWLGVLSIAVQVSVSRS